MNIYTFGETIRNARKSKKLPLRKVAAILDIDQSTLSKIERGDRLAPRNLILPISEVLDLEYKELLTNYLSDRIAYSILKEENCKTILSFAERKVEYFKSVNSKQLNINFD